MSVEFCDTNVVVYAYDTSAGAKHARARQLLERLWLDGVGAVSVQVLQELFVTLTLKICL
jgi:predicted nucleic acid-binding protein